MIINGKDRMYDFNFGKVQFKLCISFQGFFEPFFGRIQPIGYDGFRMQFLGICFQWVTKSPINEKENK
jgi:hypothetical protein